jgi:hypothetical protein
MRDDRPSLDLPSIEPGQIWLIEHDPGEAFCRFDGAVLGQANVVLYDRALAPLVAQALPIGAYAEPLPGAAPAAGPAIAPRARFRGRGLDRRSAGRGKPGLARPVADRAVSAEPGAA